MQLDTSLVARFGCWRHTLAPSFGLSAPSFADLPPAWFRLGYAFRHGFSILVNSRNVLASLFESRNHLVDL
jgi:hypothetical protein